MKKKVISYFFVAVGSLLIALSMNLILIPNNLFTFGVDGIGIVIEHVTEINPSINMFIINMIVILIASLYLDKHVLKMYILPAIMIPCFVFVTTPLANYFVLDLPEKMLALIVAASLSIYGYNFIYKQGYSGCVIFLIDEIFGKLTRFHSKLYSWVIDISLMIMSLNLFGFENALYSLCIIMITRYMITKVRFGINDSKMFYIITSKEKEVKNYIIHDLKYELTVLDVKGGFSRKNNQILLTVISSNDYFKLKEGIKIIDPKAFIAITETYDVLNRKSF